MLVIDLDLLGMLISNQQEGSALSFVAWIMIGLVTGFLGSRMVNKAGYGPGRDCLLGIVGAIGGGFLSNLLGNARGPGLDIYSLLG